MAAVEGREMVTLLTGALFSCPSALEQLHLQMKEKRLASILLKSVTRSNYFNVRVWHCGIQNQLGWNFYLLSFKKKNAVFADSPTFFH